MHKRRIAGAVAAGLLLTAALPPFGWWPLALLGAAGLVLVLDEQTGRRRALLAYAAAVGFLVPGLWWMHEFTLPGYVLAVLFEGLLFAIAPFLARSRPQLVAALVLADALRASWPFGGVPVATIAQTQIGGPLMQVARVGGELLITALVVVGGIALLEARQRRWTPAAACVGAVLIVTLLGYVAPRGDRVGSLDVAAVQGGGERGTRAIDSDEDEVFQRHVAASADLPDGLDLILWPENVVHVDAPVVDTPEGDAISAIAAEHQATLVTGVVIGGEVEDDADVFINLAEAWGPDGESIGRYEKNARVPFGEFIPFRSIVEALADVSAVPRDARVGHEPGYLETPAGNLGVVVSWEVFFADRARDAISSGGEVLLVPTNAASFSNAQMPALELGAARLRAIETGRDVVQAAPTGFTAFVRPNGDVVEHSDLGAQQVLHHTVGLREGKTLYTRLGDGPFVVLSALAMVIALVRRRR